MLASVIINNHNYAPYLRDAIDSALGQTFPNAEVVVVDDGSTDESREILASYGNRVVRVLKENGGQGSAFNAGLSVSHGDVIVFLDSDDGLLPEALARAVPLFDDQRVVKVHWPLWEVDAQGRRSGASVPDELAEGDLLEVVLREGPAGHGGNPPSSGNAWRRSFLERIFPVPEETFRIWADVYLLELAPVFGRIQRISEPLGLYRLHGLNRYAGRPFEERLAHGLKVYDRVCEVLCERLAAGGAHMSVAECREKSWFHRVARSVDDICDVVPCGEAFILVDGDELGFEAVLRGRRRFPLPERDGRYWGLPADSQAAIAEVERLRRCGARFLVLAWPAFWWSTHYQEWRRFLDSRFSCLKQTPRLEIFRLSPRTEPAGTGGGRDP